MQITYAPPASLEEALNLPVDRLAFVLLTGFAASTGRHFQRNSVIQGAKQAYAANGVKDYAEALRALGEAFDWLRNQGLRAADPRAPAKSLDVVS